MIKMHCVVILICKVTCDSHIGGQITNERRVSVPLQGCAYDSVCPVPTDALGITVSMDIVWLAADWAYRRQGLLHNKDVSML